MINSKELVQYTKDLTLLFAEDHHELRVNTAEILKSFFKEVDSAENGRDALSLYNSKAKNQPYDIVLTDIQMPYMNGIELTDAIYKKNPDQIVIVLSAHEETEYLLPLINLGIEQFLKKPIDYQKLLEVLLNVSKKISNQKQEHINNSIVYLNKEVSFNKETKILLYDSESVYLSKYEILFLELLSESYGKVFSNDDIVSYFTGLQESIDSQNIRKLVSKLRKKLPENSIESIYGVGYRIIPFYR